MPNIEQCSRCLERLPNNQLYFIRKNWIGFDCACMNCIKKPSCKLNPPLPLTTVEEYRLGVSGRSLVNQSVYSQEVNGTTKIDGKPYAVVLEEITTVTRRIKLTPD